MPGSSDDIFAPRSVAALFDEMALTYGVVNILASFGFTAIWRRVMLRRVRLAPALVVCDLMTGMGENVAGIMKRAPDAHVVAVDLSHVMCDKARETADRYRGSMEVLNEDALHSSIATASVDVVTCSFGLKTFSPEGQAALAAEVTRILKPGGQFAFIEIALPKPVLMRALLTFYLRWFIPVIGKLCLGNPDNYRMLFQYTSRFGNALLFRDALRENGLNAESFSHFFGCASGVSGTKPVA